MERNNRPWVQVSLNKNSNPPDRTRITYTRPNPHPYGAVATIATTNPQASVSGVAAVSYASGSSAADITGSTPGNTTDSGNISGSNTVTYGIDTNTATGGSMGGNSVATGSATGSVTGGNSAVTGSITGSTIGGNTASGAAAPTGRSGANLGPETFNDALKRGEPSTNYTSPSRAGEFFPGGSTPPNLELPIGVEIPPIDEMPPIGITTPEGEVIGYGRCLGRYSIGYIGQIEYFLLQELNLRQSLLALANTEPAWSEVIAPIADVFLTSAERLASAYYSIAGNVYWPATVPGISSNAMPEVELNRLYAATRWLEGEYRVNAARISDPCLAALYEDLASIKAAQARSLLMIVGISGEELDEEET